MYDEHVSRTIELVQGQVLNLEQELAEKRRMVNGLCGLIGRAPVYANVEPAPGASVGIRGDEFYGKPLSSAVRSILEKRAAAGLWAATLDEIFDAMLQGGFKFEAKNAGTAKRSLAISLSKNAVTFHKLPNGTIGLTEWYPEAVKGKAGNGGKKDEPKQVEPVVASSDADTDEPYPNDFADAEPELTKTDGDKATSDTANGKTSDKKARRKVSGARRWAEAQASVQPEVGEVDPI
jgi:hypothetical protein